MTEKSEYLKKHGMDHLIEVLKDKAQSVPLPNTFSLRNVETKQGEDWFQIIINCYSPRCCSGGKKVISVLSDEFKEIYTHLIDKEYIHNCGYVCQDSEVLPDYGQSAFHSVGTCFWFQFMRSK